MQKYEISWKSNKYKKNDIKLARLIFYSYACFVVFCYIYIGFAIAL